MMNQKNDKFYAPIVFLFAWLTVTVLTFSFGPYVYKINNAPTLYSYLACIHIALLGGYLWGQTFPGYCSVLKVDYYKLVKASILISIFYIIIKLVFTSGGDLRNFFLTFDDANKSYDNNSLRKPNVFSYLDMILVPIIVIAISNTVFLYGKIEKKWRFFVYTIIAILIALSIGSATRSGIVKNGMFIFSALILGIYNKNIIPTFIHKIFICISVTVFITSFFLYFSLLVKTRDVLGYVVEKNPITKELPDPQNLLLKITPNGKHKLVNDIAFYISHSYFRLSKAMELPSKGYGLGLSNSYFVMHNVEKLTGSTWLKDISYPIRLDKQEGNAFGAFWSTFYSWIASDFSFPGTIVVVFIIGFLFALTLRDALHSLNFLAVTSFCVLFYFIFHFAFNNPLQDGQGVMTFFMIPFLWFIFRDRRTE